MPERAVRARPASSRGFARATTLVAVTERAPLSRKLSAIAESATLKVDAKAKALQAAGRPVISYAAGEPDFATPQFIVDAAAEALHDPANYRYTPAVGLPGAARGDRREDAARLGARGRPSQMVVTNGGKQAVYQAFQAVVNPGDEVLLPAPYWTTYPEAIALADGVPVEVFAGADQDYKVTVEQLEAARTDKTTVLVFVSPSNPTGSVYTPDETKAIGEWAVEHGIWIISDEIYQNLVYEGVRAVSIVEAVPDAAAQTILVNGVAKTYAMTGWRLGWMVGPKDAIKLAANLQSHLSSEREQHRAARRAGRAHRTADRSGGVPPRVRPAPQARSSANSRRSTASSVPNPLGAFYVYPDVQGLLGRTWRGKTPDDLARTRRPHPRRGRGRGRARRGVRPERLPAAVVRARRRGAARGRPPHAGALQLLTRSRPRICRSGVLPFVALCERQHKEST